MIPAKLIQNKTWGELRIDDSASLHRCCTVEDLLLFSHISGNTNPATLPGGVETSGYDEPVAPSMWIGALISAVLGNLLPGPGTLYRSQSLDFARRVHIGDRLLVTVRCKEKLAEPLARFATEVTDAAGRVVCSGAAVVEAPKVRIETRERDLPALIVEKKDRFARLEALARRLPALRTAVVCPEDRQSLGGALLALERSLIKPILVGHPEHILAAADALGADISGLRLIEAASAAAAAGRAIALARAGEIDALMQGAIHADEFLGAAMKKDSGLRGARKLSHAFVMDAPGRDELLFISDAEINISPDLRTKVDIVQNAIDLARACGVEKPRVGVLSAVETVNALIPSSVDAAILSKMAERGQIEGAAVDGPLALDNALDAQTCKKVKTRNVASLVAGRANVLIAPNLEAGAILAREMTFIARAEAAGLALGARIPIILSSRADKDGAPVASCALAALYAYWLREGTAFRGLAVAAPAAAE